MLLTCPIPVACLFKQDYNNARLYDVSNPTGRYAQRFNELAQNSLN